MLTRNRTRQLKMRSHHRPVIWTDQRIIMCSMNDCEQNRSLSKLCLTKGDSESVGSVLKMTNWEEKTGYIHHHHPVTWTDQRTIFCHTVTPAGDFDFTMLFTKVSVPPYLLFVQNLFYSPLKRKYEVEETSLLFREKTNSEFWEEIFGDSKFVLGLVTIVSSLIS